MRKDDNILRSWRAQIQGRAADLDGAVSPVAAAQKVGRFVRYQDMKKEDPGKAGGEGARASTIRVKYNTRGKEKSI